MEGGAVIPGPDWVPAAVLVAALILVLGVAALLDAAKAEPPSADQPMSPLRQRQIEDMLAPHRERPCPMCKGTGIEPDEWDEPLVCLTCRGRGTIRQEQRT
jgi:hypothetical protein